MADTPIPTLTFTPGCGDCGGREVTLPLPLPQLGDDFDWLVRDYDGFRLFMMEELAARYPERRRWTPADMEVVLTEALSVILDQQSDALDRIQAEAFLSTARRPESVRRLLALIGYDAIALADTKANIPDATPSIGETQAETRTRLEGFKTGIETYIDQYAFVVDQLTAAQQTGLQNFLNDSANATAADLAATQLFLDKAPSLVVKIRRDALNRYWTLYPRAMEMAREAGPRAIHVQKRMVTVTDYAQRLEDHPLVLHTQSQGHWTGSWSTIYVTGILFANITLDTPITEASIGGSEALAVLQDNIDTFHRQRELDEVDWSIEPTARTILRWYLDAYRMAGQEVFLQDAEVVGINISLSVRIAGNYFQSEVRRAVNHRLGNGLGGFFEPGQLQFGEDLFASDIIEAVMALAGVEAVCLNRFKRVGKRYADQSDSGRIQLNGEEVALCDNNNAQPARGILRVVIHGGRRG